jgi:hypothetical protein
MPCWRFFRFGLQGLAFSAHTGLNRSNRSRGARPVTARAGAIGGSAHYLIL